MLTFTHTYVLNLAYKNIHQRNIQPDRSELILGNVIPDFVTHLDRTPFQALAHDLSFLTASTEPGSLEWGAIFHVLCDNYSTLGSITFDGNYHDFPRNGFIEELSRQVVINIPLIVPRRRILQCALDILVLREEKELLIQMLKAAHSFLNKHFLAITRRVASIYHIDPNRLKIGLNRFLAVYGVGFLEQSASEEYRLFALARSMLNLGSLTDPQIIMQGVRDHPELKEVVDVNMKLIQDNWINLLEDTVREVMKYPGLKRALTERK